MVDLGSNFPALNYVDMSRWGGPLTAEEARCMRDRGIVGACIASGPGNYGLHAEQQATAALNADMFVDAYSYLEYGYDPGAWAQAAIDRLRGLPVRTWWVDAEDTENGRTWSWRARVAHIDSAFHVFDAHAGHENVGYYGGGWYHVGYLGNHKGWSDRRLWDANYPRGASPDNAIITPWAGREYGGFSEPEIYQFAGTTDVCGQSVDLNWARIVPAAKGDESMIDTELRDAMAKREQIRRHAAQLAVNSAALQLEASDLNLANLEATWQRLRAAGLIR